MDEFELDEQAKQLRTLQLRQMEIRLENTMLSEHLSRVVVTRKGSLQLHLDNLEQEQEERDEEEEETGKKSRSSRASTKPGTPAPKATVRFSAMDPSVRPELGIPLSMEEKCDIADDECAYLEQHIEKMRAENEHVLDDFRAIYNEAKQCMGEVRKDRCDFNRDVLLLATLNPSGKPYSEDILGFIKEKLRRKRSVRDSFLNKNNKLRAEINGLERLFATKKDLKDILHAVDFDQLNILNHQLTTKMRDRTKEIRRLKDVTKVTMEALAETQKELLDAYDRGSKYRQSLSDRTPVIQITKKDIAAERSQRHKLHEAVLITLQDQDGPAQPTAMDYMKARDKAFNLRKEIKTWLSKVEVAELTRHELEKGLSFLQRDMAMRDSPMTV